MTLIPPIKAPLNVIRANAGGRIDVTVAIYKERGYLVISEREPWPIGEVYDVLDGEDGTVHQPLRIMEQTTAADAMEQVRAYSRLSGIPFNQMKCNLFLNVHPYHYRVVTD